MKAIALRVHHLKGFSESNLYLFKQFYTIYPQIFQSLTGKFQASDFQGVTILQAATEEFKTKELSIQTPTNVQMQTDPDLLINHLSFTHIIELLKANSQLKRTFYETETIKNNWSVKDLQRAMNSMLFERTGLSTDKRAVLEKHLESKNLNPEDVFRNPYVLEFLGLEEGSIQ